MKVHEYQAKQMLAGCGVPVPRGEPAATPDEARAVAEKLAVPVVVKAQIHAGGRGKGGGVKLADTPQQAFEAARQVIGMTLVTPQTGPQGRVVKKVLVEEQVRTERELYLSVVIDSAAACPVMIASAAGGMEIEEVAAKSPELIHRVAIDPAFGLMPYQARQLAFAVGLTGDLLRPATQLMAALYDAFAANDCSLAEINPLVVTTDGRLLALDAKMNFDDNALFRHPEIAALRDLDEEDSLEVQAQELGINNYVKLSGNIGCVVNGAGLAMSTMDAIKQVGGDPANFLDIGTVNDVSRVVNAFRLLTADPQVKAILINIFGGMARVDIIAQGVVDAHKTMKIDVPVIVRLAGTNVEEGERILRDVEFPLIRADGLAEAARKAVEAAAATGESAR
ncbi:MAG: ADP-forming succinate--CoA ligase subunit beta [Dehalococcoidia bacterium]|nr:ADP-forming succinate--CoA ligase subunit beta [Dehalococcoidia bacterium]